MSAVKIITARVAKMITGEKTAFDACIAKLTVPNKDTDPVKYMSTVNPCYNVIGKKDWDCTGSRRTCDTGLCCGTVKDTAQKVTETICYTSTAAKKDTGIFTCNASKTKGAN